MSSVNVIALPPSTSPESASLTDELLMKVDTASPELETLSSLIAVNWLLAVKLLLPLSVRIEDTPPTRTGAAFMGLTFNSTTSVPELNSEVPPFVEVSTLVPAAFKDVLDVTVF